MLIYENLVNALIAELEGALRSVDPAQIDALRSAILKAPRIFIAGKGRSGLQMRGFAMRLMHLGLTAHVVDDVTTPGLSADDLLIIGSGSGKTASLVEYAKRAKVIQAKVGLITIAPSSPVADNADYVVRISAPTPKLEGSDAKRSIQPMGNLFEQSLGLLLDMITIQMMDELKLTSDQMFKRHANLE